MIELSHVTKTYETLVRRPLRAVDDLSLRVDGGEIVGVGGAEGAGKSTLVALILGFFQPSSGSVRVGGRPPRAFVESEGVGYLPQVIALPRWWKVQGALERLAILAGVPASRASERIEAVTSELGLAELRGRRIRSLDPGELRRLGLAQALTAPQRVVILESPTDGLDLGWTERVRGLVSRLRAPDRAILVASRDVEELQRIADRVVVMDRGSVRRVLERDAPRSIGHERGAAGYRSTTPGSREVV